MFPDLFSIGPVTIHTYGLFVAIGFLAGLMVTVRIARTEGIPAQQVMDMGFIMIVSAIVGSRIMYILINPTHYFHRPLEILKIWQGGLVFSGGIIGVILVMAWYGRRHGLSLWKIGDLWSPAAALGQAVGRIGCFMAGCCFGKPTDVNWAVVFTHPQSLAPKHIPLHPTQLYHSLSGFIIFGILLALRRKKGFDGRILLWFLILHSTARLLVERFRGDLRGILPHTQTTLTQVVAVGILIGAVITLLILKTRAEKGHHPVS